MAIEKRGLSSGQVKPYAPTIITEGHTVRRYDGELSSLRLHFLEMGGLVLSQLQQAIRALMEGDLAIARKVIETDAKVDAYDLAVDQESMHILARRAPMASDLRAIIAIGKAVSDLERVGDEAERIARLAEQLYRDDFQLANLPVFHQLKRMAMLATDRLRESVSAFDRMDAQSALLITRRDRALSDAFQETLREVAINLPKTTDVLENTIRIVLAVRSLERVGDHATNIAEHVVYLVHGRDIRHGGQPSAGPHS